MVPTANSLADFRYVSADIGNDGVSVQDKFGLERDKSVATKRRHTEHTLKI